MERGTAEEALVKSEVKWMYAMGCEVRIRVKVGVAVHSVGGGCGGSEH